MEKNIFENIENMINNIIINYNLDDNIDKDKLKIVNEIIFMILNEIAQNENTKLENLELIGKGDYSYVYKLGNKIIKIGKSRETNTFPNNPYIIKPLLRKSFEIGDKNQLFIEICEKVQTNCCTFEDVYILYKKLRNISLVWVDPKLSNIGILERDNKIYWNKNLNPNDKTLMLDNYRKDSELKKGELVIIDADSIYDENNKPAHFQKVCNYEHRYKKELNSSI